VIVAKITPCMENGKCAIGRRLRSGVAFGSTEFHVLRATQHVIPEWLFYFWRFPPTRKLASVNMTGSAGQKRVPASFLETADIPLPSLSEQRRIAGQLDQADRLRRTRRYALELSDSFLPAAFLELFGGYLTPACSSVLNDALALPLSNGFFEKRSVYGTGVPVIWVDNLYHTVTINLENLRRARATPEQITAYQLMEGDLLFTRSSLVREGIGQINIVPRLFEPTMFECHVIRARVDPKRVNPFYVLGLYRSSFGKAHILTRANTATMTTISQSALEELPCPLPPLSLQEKFADLVERAECLRAVQREALRQADHLFAALLHRAFSG
jgi:type I restriction enzyme S subunit